MLGGDARKAIPNDVLADSRVATFWDPKRTLGTWFADRNIGDQPILWDAYLLFGPDAKWNNKPKPFAFGDPILGTTRQLAKAISKVA